MIYRYKCTEHGEFELSHSINDDRKTKVCPECNELAKPLISTGIGMQLTGRPPWAYNDARRAAASIEEDKKTGISKDTTLTDKREGSATYGQKIKLNKNMGGYNAQW